MSFDDLHEHIQGTFAALSGADEYDQQLTLWCFRRQQARAEQRPDDIRRARESERRNRDRVLARRRERYREATRDRDKLGIYQRNWLARKPVGECRQCPSPAAPGKKLCQPHLDRAVAYQLKSRARRSPQT